MRDLKEAKHFGDYIKKLREKRGYLLNQVCEGLCTQQQLSLLEKGERNAPKLLQDALLERLGVGAEDYEHYLPYKEYDHWEARQRLQHRISYEETERAAQLLEQYRVDYINGSKEVVGRLERQFYLSMLAQIRSQEGAGMEELSVLYNEAVGLTMPSLWEKPLAERALSLKELNLILEAEQYREGRGEAAHYREVLRYIERAGLDRIGMAKVYPKTVYFLCRCMAGEIEKERSMEQQLLKYCNIAIEYLRDSSRMYYLWELLDMRGQFLARMTERLLLAGEQKKAEALEPMRRDTELWKENLESVYAEYGVPKETGSYGYLYVEKGVSCTNDVIRIRREMLGMSQKELCEGICELKSLRKLENRLVEPHRDRVRDLFERLGLPRELTRTEIVTEEPEARRLMEELRECINDRRIDEAEDLIVRIRELVSVAVKCNLQVLLRAEINIAKMRKEIDAVEYYEKIRSILNLTVPYDAFLKEGDKYLTYEEQCCIQNMMNVMDRESDEYFVCMMRFEEMYHFFEEKELIETVNSTYELIMETVGSEWGNRGDYNRADRYSGIIVMECLRSRRLYSIAAGLYDRWWNYAERKKEGIPVDKELNDKDELTKCLVFSILAKQKHYLPFYQYKLKMADERKY